MINHAMNTRLLFVFLTLAATPAASAGPYSPAAGQPGSDAVPYTDPGFVEWASGYQNYIEGSPINSTYTNPNETLGPAQGTTTGVTELGDGGQITLTFNSPIVANPDGGPDFAVFGNAFAPGYLKLAYVEVSQDGVNWYTMPNYSLTPGLVATYSESMDPTNISGLAGKFVVGYGVPFSISSVNNFYGVDLTSVSYVKIVDITGNGTDLDSAGNPIYDPYPNDNGFNVAGVGVFSDAASVVPEPGSAIMMLAGATFVAMAGYRHRTVRTSRFVD